MPTGRNEPPTAQTCFCITKACTGAFSLHQTLFAGGLGRATLWVLRPLACAKQYISAISKSLTQLQQRGIQPIEVAADLA